MCRLHGLVNHREQLLTYLLQIGVLADALALHVECCHLVVC